MMVQLVQFSMSLIVTAHCGVDGHVIITGKNAKTDEELFTVNIK